jgi:hypothetical protein
MADLLDPSIPGVFSFESEDLFVDSVVQVKCHTPRDLAVERTPFGPVGGLDVLQFRLLRRLVGSRSSVVARGETATRPSPTHFLGL